MHRKCLWLLLWILVAGFGLSWVGVQKMLLRQSIYGTSTELEELKRNQEELQIERIQHERVLLRSGSLRTGNLFGNSADVTGVPLPGLPPEEGEQ